LRGVGGCRVLVDGRGLQQPEDPKAQHSAAPPAAQGKGCRYAPEVDGLESIVQPSAQDPKMQWRRGRTIASLV
jgi:hypothetical protein